MITIFIIVAAGDGGEGGVINMNIINIHKRHVFTILPSDTMKSVVRK